MRELSEGNVYHVVVRGVGRQLIFEDEADRKRFLDMVGRQRGKTGCEVLAWCLMENHVHLLLRAGMEEVSAFMQGLSIGYSKYFNRKYGRTGHLFQGRFASEAVDADEYLVAVVCYIHRNPVNAGFVKACGDYRWSSYNAYVRHPDAPGRGFVLEVFGGLRAFEEAHLVEDDYVCVIEDADARPAVRMGDDEALRVACAVAGNVPLHELRALRKPERDGHLREMKQRGLSVRQIERITGIGRGIVARA